MNTLLNITSKIVMVCFLFFVNVIPVFSKSPKNSDIIKRVENLNTIIDMRITDEVMEQVYTLIEKRKKDAQTILGRTSLYFPLIENALRERNLPDELKYIAVIESGLLPDVESHQGAAGIWQFMRGTAELYGLKIDSHIDERCDLNKSTEKALDYLKLLYESYGNWTLALAAYNCGTGTLNKAIKKAGGIADYWQVYEYLPKETRKYIPRFIAVSYLMNYYYLHDLSPIDPSDELKYIVTIKVFDKVEFKKISKEFEIDLDLIRFLNPMYKKDYIPANEDGVYTLILPDVVMFSYIEKYGNLDQIVTSPYNFKRPIEEPVPAETPFSYPKISEVAFLHRRGILAKDPFVENKKFRTITKDLMPDNKQIVWYKMKRKESLTDIAKANNIELEDLLAYNNIDPTKGLAPGSLIKLTK